MKGSISITIGPMGSGKTTSLLQTANKYADFGFNVLVVGAKKDTRGTSIITSHNSSILLTSSKFKFVAVDDLLEVDVTGVTYIFIDEAHFYSNLVQRCKDWAFKLGKHVLVYGLNGDCYQQPIGKISELIPLANGNITNLHSFCKLCLSTGCTPENSLANFTVLKVADKRIGQIQVGGLESYEAVCIAHLDYYKTDGA